MVSVEALLVQVGDAMMPRIRKPKPRKRRDWTPQEDAYLEKHYRIKPVTMVARALKRSVNSVTHRAQRIGLCYVPHLLTLTSAQVQILLGIGQAAIARRVTDRAIAPIPHERIGRFIEFSHADLYAWLRAGNVLAFDRAKIHPDLHRMYDDWRAKVMHSTEVYDECVAIGEKLRAGRGGKPKQICVMPGKVIAYLKEDIFNFAYLWGHTITPDASPRFQVIRHAWDTEYILKYEVNSILGVNYCARFVTPFCASSSKYVYKRSELCARLVQLGRDDLAKRWRSTPVPWQEMMYDYERRHR